MFLVLVSVILLQMFLIILKNFSVTKSKWIILGSICSVLSIGYSRYMQNFIWLWSTFFVFHILLLGIYLFIDYKEEKRNIDKLDFLLIIKKYTVVPTYFYLVPFILLAIALKSLKTTDEGFEPVVFFSVLCLIACIYNYLENRSIKKSYIKDNKIVEKTVTENTYRKITILLLYCIMLSLASGMLYCSKFVAMKEKTVALIFVFEIFCNLTIYSIYSYKLKSIFLQEDFKYPKGQLFVPKKIGIGYTLNFNNPLSYIIIFIGIAILLIFLLT